jgi:hypothetical protein
MVAITAGILIPSWIVGQGDGNGPSRGVERRGREMISDVRVRGPELTMTARLLWLVVVAIVVAWLVLVLVGAATT